MTRHCALAGAQMGRSAACVPARHSRPRPARERRGGIGRAVGARQLSSPARRSRQQCRTQERRLHTTRERTHARWRIYTHRACSRHGERRSLPVHVLNELTNESSDICASAAASEHAVVVGVGRRRIDVLRRTEGPRGHGVEDRSRGRPPAGRCLGRPRLARTHADGRGRTRTAETTLALTRSAARLLCSLARPRPHAPVHPTCSAAILNGGAPAPWLIAASGARGQCAEFRHGRPPLEPTPPAAGARIVLVRKSKL